MSDRTRNGVHAYTNAIAVPRHAPFNSGEENKNNLLRIEQFTYTQLNQK